MTKKKDLIFNMNSFVSKQILTTQTIGERLCKARKGWGLTLDEVASKISIKHVYLASIEVGQYQELPGDVYTLEYIKRYARFLHMDPIVAAKAYRLERTTHSAHKTNKSRTRTGFLKIIRMPYVDIRILAKGVVLIGVLSIFVYGAYFAHAFFSPPVLEITSPSPYQHTEQSGVILQGAIQGGREVFLNNEPIAVGGSGDFFESFYLPEGLNLLSVTARSRRGKETTQYFTIIVEEKGTVVSRQ